MPPHTNNPHYQSQQQQQQQQQQQPQQQSQQGQPPQSQQVQTGNAPPNGHNVAVNVSRGSGEQQSVVASAHQQMYQSQPISAGYMAGGPPGNAMYPMHVVPPHIPGNVYVSNLTANVNVHGFMPHGMPQYMTATGTPPAPSGAYISGEVPSGHEMQVMTPRGDGRGGMRRNGRSNRIGHNARPRGAYVPHHIVQHQTVMQQGLPGGIHQQQQQSGQQGQGQLPQQGVQQSQQQQSQSQGQNQQQNQPSQPPQQHTPDLVQHPMSMEHQQMISPAQPYGYSGGYYFYPQFFPQVQPGHPSTQHAAGAPIFQVPMYSTGPMYSYSPGVVYQQMYPQEYPMYDDKGDEHNPQQPPEEGVMHPGMWQPPTMLEYNPETVEYIPQEDDGSMMQQGPPPMQPMTHVLDPNVPNFTMGPTTPIQTEEYGSMTPAPSDEYNAINNNAMMSPAANLISSPSSNASSQNNLNQNDMYLVPQPPQQEPQDHHQHLQQQQHQQHQQHQQQQQQHQQQQQQQHQQQHQQHQQHQQQSHAPLMEMPQESVIQHEEQPSPMVDHENNYIVEQAPQLQYNQPMSPPPPQQSHIHAQVAAPMESNYNSELPPVQAQIQEQTPMPMQTIVQDTMPTPMQQPAPIPSAVATLNKPPPPIPVEFLNLEKQQQQHHHHHQQQQQQQQLQQHQHHQQQQHHQSIANDSNNNPKKKTNEVASVATPATVAVDKTSETSANSSKSVPNQQQPQQHHQSQVFVNSNKNQTSTDEVARLTRAVQDKFVFKDDRRNGPYRGSNTWANSGSQPPATTISSFTSPTTTVVQHNSSQQKKTTASVSVSAIPNKEFPISSSNSSGPSVTSSTKPYQKNTSPVPFTTLGTTSAPPSMHKLPLAPQKSFSSSTEHHSTPVNPGPVMESKKVEAIPQRDIQINTPLPPPGPPPLLSVPPPQPPYTQGPIIVPTPYAPPPPATTVAAAPAAKSWASLFNSSSSSSGSTPPSSSIVQPIPTPAPVALAAGPALPTPSPFAPSFIPSLQRGSQSSATSTQSTDTPPASVAMKKPVAKVLPFDKNNSGGPPTSAMSYSAASAQGLPSSGHATSSTSTSASAASASAGSKNNKNNAAAQAQAAAAAAKPEQLDENTLKLGEFLSAYQIENNSISILPRGLINRSNYCYINAILQALVACPPFYHLMRAIRSLPAARNSKHQKPFIDAMTALGAEFSTLPLRSKVLRDKSKKDETPEIQCDSPIEPLMIHKMLNLLRSDIFQVEGRQEDAEEFLGCVLNRLNDEMIELMKLSKNESSDFNGDDAANGEVHLDDQDDWKVIRGNRNKGTITRTTDFGRSPMSDIFGGKLRSRVHREGDHPTDNIQPFFTLQLDIEKAASVKDALDLLVGKDQLEGVTCSKTKQEIAAWQQVTLEELPIVMILHLKCFDYKMDGCTKILKPLEFPIELKIDSKLMSSKGKSYTAKQKQYKLFAVVYHDGKEASKGHYITDVFHAGYGSWIRYDDSSVKAVSESNVLHPKSPRVPYLLYYRRLDTHYHGGGGSGGGGGGSGTGASVSSGTGTAGFGTGNSGNTISTNSSSSGSSTISSSGGNSNYSSSGNSYSATTGGHYAGSK